MRAFKRIVLGLLAVYAILFIHNNFAFNNPNKDNILSAIADDHSGRRIVLFGKSPCEFGLSAALIEKEVNGHVYNYCHNSFNNDENLFLLLKVLNEDDYVVITRRFEFAERPKLYFLQDIILLPLARFFITDMMRKIFNYHLEDVSYDRFGDLQKFTNVTAAKANPYFFNGSIIEDNLRYQFDSIFKNRKIAPKIIWLTAPLLVDENTSLPISTVRHGCAECPQLVAWLPPLQYNDPTLFIDDKIHLNSRGRAVWSETVAATIRDILAR
jgi:hypothetical protein